MAERAKFTYREHSRWRLPPYWISKNVSISGFDEDISTKFGGTVKVINNCKMVFSLHVVDRRSDNYNF